jgi:hypothetical protein
VSDQVKVRRNDRVRLVKMRTSRSRQRRRRSRSSPTAKRRNHDHADSGHYLVLGAILFAISIVGIFLNRKNIIVC